MVVNNRSTDAMVAMHRWSLYMIVYDNQVDKLASILSGEKPIYLNLQFLIRNDKTDPLILKQTKVD